MNVSTNVPRSRVQATVDFLKQSLVTAAPPATETPFPAFFFRTSVFFLWTSSFAPQPAYSTLFAVDNL